MSIINDALKKVQSSLNHNNKAPDPAPNAVPAEPAQSFQKPAGEWGPPPQWDATAPTEPAAAPAPQPTIPAAAMAATAVKANANKMVYILGVICLLIALFAPIVNHQSVFGLITHSGKKPALLPSTATRVDEPMAIGPSVSQKAAEIKAELARSLVNFNNPAASTTTRSPSGKRITLSGIMAQGNKNVALIDGQVYEAGETVDGIKIVAINEKNIVIEENGQQNTIKVGQ
jgi:hypothetical protein